jgi:hypothetical protein
MNMPFLSHAFKEWAVICQALAEGRQSLILRKGGIAEVGGEFHVEHQRFWLYPTWVHQQQRGISSSAGALLEQALAQRPPAGRVRLTHFADVAKVWQVSDLARLLTLAGFHFWSEETVRARFAYRRPGLFALAVRLWRSPASHELEETPAYAGCKSWVELAEGLRTEGTTPVLQDGAFLEVLEQLEVLSRPL